MARLPRINLPGIPQHVIQRGNNQNACFFSEQDYLIYLDKLSEYSQQHQVKIHSYVLMTNHVHLLLTPDEPGGVSLLMQALGRYYVRYINQTYRRTGTLWEGRYKSSLVDSDNYLLTVYRYIELNPVRAQMVNHPLEYPWSSYQTNALGKRNELITPHFNYLALGKNDTERHKNYSQLFEKSISANTLERIRNSTNKAWVLGNNHFKKQIEEQIGRRVTPLKRGGDRKSKTFRLSKDKIDNKRLSI